MSKPQVPEQYAHHLLNDYIACKDLPAAFPHLVTEGQMRWALRNRHSNGLDKAIAKLGKRLYVHLPTFIKWLDETRCIS